MAHMYWNLASINGKERAGIYRDSIAKGMTSLYNQQHHMVLQNNSHHKHLKKLSAIKMPEFF
jgi:hypothetical protein